MTLNNNTGLLRRYKLRVNFVGTDAYDTNDNFLPYRKLIYLANGTEKVGNVRSGIEAMFRELYPEEGRCEVDRLRDSHLCDVSDNFLVSDVFDESPLVYAAMKGLQDERSLSLPVASTPITTEHSQIIAQPKRRRYTMTPSRDVLATENNTDVSDSERLARAAKVIRQDKTLNVNSLELHSPELTSEYAGQLPKRTFLDNNVSPSPAFPYSHDKAVSQANSSTGPALQIPVVRGSTPTSDFSSSIPQTAATLVRVSPEIDTPLNPSVENTTVEAPAENSFGDAVVNSPRLATTTSSDSSSTTKEHGRPTIEVVVRRSSRLFKGNTGGNGTSANVDASNGTPQKQSHKRKVSDFLSSSSDGSDKERAVSTATTALGTSTGGAAGETPGNKRPKLDALQGLAVFNSSTTAAPESEVLNDTAGAEVGADVHSTGNNEQPNLAKEADNFMEPLLSADTMIIDNGDVTDAGTSFEGSTAENTATDGVLMSIKAIDPSKFQIDSGNASSSEGEGGSSSEESSSDESSSEEEDNKQDSTPNATKRKVSRSKPAVKPKTSTPVKNAAQSKAAVKKLLALEADAGCEDEISSSSPEEESDAEGSSSSGESSSESSDEDGSSSSGESSDEEPLIKSKPKPVAKSKSAKSRASVTANSAVARGDKSSRIQSGNNGGGNKDSDTESESDYSVDSDSSLESNASENSASASAKPQLETKSTKNSKGLAKKKVNDLATSNNRRTDSTNGARLKQLPGPTTPSATPLPKKTKTPTGVTAATGTQLQTPKRKKNNAVSDTLMTTARRKVMLSKPTVTSEDSVSSDSEEEDSDIPLRRLDKLPVLGTPTTTRRSSGVLELARSQRVGTGKDGSGVMSISQMASARPYDDLRKKMAKYASTRGMANVAGSNSRKQNKVETEGESSSESDSSSSSDEDMDAEFDVDAGRGSVTTAGGGGSAISAQQGQWRPIRFAGSVKLTGSAKARRRKSALMSL
ncbi:hypothetical protein COEREDRAFT_85059 [Coemansia reversa NRRL 1564]|uniref:Nucleolar protein Dnt1-like N-terminal domain-containing protein n=1 Tax=Coemansia reversa (strain ATCC 12441 / NRRL 1564) TaxID=763665 RepID=A0A2G5BHT6_COERN|nr:hypothetical protein COEREDRAFT_85059 [Coemansia reversa NRRL 1564]|eukprot:PIA18580.1 hypothetical protein COEREDRAFT_85059 [Coemansia reversa NRRL 1564]